MKILIFFTSRFDFTAVAAATPAPCPFTLQHDIFLVAAWDILSPPVARPVTNKPLILSTGMSTLEEIKFTANYLDKNQADYALLHCNSTYPMKDEDANLLCIPMLRKTFNCDVGYSGHESCLLKVCLVAASLGASSIERHITLDRAMYGSDQAASIEVGSLKGLVESVRAVSGILGTGQKDITEAEQVVRNKLRIVEELETANA